MDKTHRNRVATCFMWGDESSAVQNELERRETEGLRCKNKHPRKRQIKESKQLRMHMRRM